MTAPDLKPCPERVWIDFNVGTPDMPEVVAPNEGVEYIRADLAPGWRPANLPPTRAGHYLVACRHWLQPNIARWMPNARRWVFASAAQKFEPEHWAELPPPPREGEVL